MDSFDRFTGNREWTLSVLIYHAQTLSYGIRYIIGKSGVKWVRRVISSCFSVPSRSLSVLICFRGWSRDSCRSEAPHGLSELGIRLGRGVDAEQPSFAARGFWEYCHEDRRRKLDRGIDPKSDVGSFGSTKNAGESHKSRFLVGFIFRFTALGRNCSLLYQLWWILEICDESPKTF